MRAPIRLSRPVTTGLALSAAALAFAAPLALPDGAHASPGGFSLPTATPTPTSQPDVEGPADDTGAVPLAPRVIPTETPTPTPIPSATPSIAPTLNPTDSATPPATDTSTVQPLPRETAVPSQTAPTDSAAAPGPTTIALPISAPTGGTPDAPAGLEEAPAEAATDATGLNTSGDLPLPDTDALPATQSSADTAAQDWSVEDWVREMPLWAWIAGGIGLLAALIAGLLLVRRRTAATAVPEIERPQVPAAPAPEPTPVTAAEPMSEIDPVAAGAAPARIDVKLEIVSATRSLMNFTLDYRLTLANRTPNAVRDVSVAAILTSAQKQAALGGQIGFDRPEPEAVPRIGPNKSHMIAGQVQLPVSKLQVMHQGNKPLFVPLLQVTITQGSSEPLTRHYVIGLPSTASASRLHPIPLDVPPGGLPGLRARELETQPA